MNFSYLCGAILTMAAVMFGLRCVPFLLFGTGKTQPKSILYLGRVMSPASVAMLVIYCGSGVELNVWPSLFPEIIAGVAIVLIHLWKRNMVFSVFGGTLFYMMLVQFIFTAP